MSQKAEQRSERQMAARLRRIRLLRAPSHAVALGLALALWASAKSGMADAPALIPIHGYLASADGDPVEGPHQISVILYVSETGTDDIHAENFSVDVAEGHFVVYLGSGEDAAIDLAMFREHSEVWAEVVIDGSEIIKPRIQLATTPFSGFSQYCAAASHATDAEHAADAEHAGTADEASEAGNAAKLAGRDASSFADTTHRHGRFACEQVDGPCGNGMYQKPTYYFDRVSFECPESHPMLSGFRFLRCGTTGTENEGLRVRATCCQVQ